MIRTNSFSIIALLIIAIAIAISCSTESTPAYTLTTTANPTEGGTITPNAGTFEEGEAVSLQAKPSEGWVFSRWEQDLSSTANPMNVTMNRDYTVVGVFEQRMHALMIDIEGEGTVTETVVQQKTTDYAEGTVVELEAVPAQDWVFSHWEGDLSGSDNPAEITVDEPKSIMAVFVTFPTVSTNSVESITDDSAQSGGEVTDDGGSDVTSRGVCWSTSQNPTTNDNCTEDGTGTGSFSSNLTNLSSDTQYYVRAYAINSVGTAYGNQRNFTTEQESELPSVTTSSISSITENSAQSGGNVTDDGGATVTARGVCWSTSQNPTTSDNCTSDGSGTGSFSSTLSGLNSATNYYMRAFATNEVGIAYGAQEVFTTQTEVVDVYNPATGRTWMDRNLGASRAATSSTDSQAYGDLYQWGRAADGHEKRNSGTTSTLSSTDTPGHGNFIIIISIYGNFDWRSPQNDNLWQGANGINNPCPDGYRLPTEAEWETELQSWSSNDTVGAFASPLKLPLAGIRGIINGSIDKVGSRGSYWSSTVSGRHGHFLTFNSYSAFVSISGDRAYGLSVRCIKD